MTGTNLIIGMIASFVLAFILGVFVMYWWYKKISTSLNRSIKNSRSLQHIAITSLFYNLPSLVVFILLFIPSLYFGYLNKQLNYCKDVVALNGARSDFDFKDPEFIKDCGCYTKNELKKGKEVGR